uniref:Histone deacetylase 12 n=1 Tax=Amphiprion ocellaris TaxID=80972 RepID=A0AAQ5X364_AMPOC
MAAEVALQRGLACSTAGGTHHAFPSYGSGFCLLNDLAVAAKYVLNTSSTKRKILIVDLDVHQVELTCHFLRTTFDFNTPAQLCVNRPLDLDISVEDGLEDQEYLSTVKEHLPWLLETFRPDLVLYDAGVDPHWDDELGRLRLTDQGEQFFSFLCSFSPPTHRLQAFLNDYVSCRALSERSIRDEDGGE